MFAFIAENISTILISAILLAVVVLIIKSLIRKKKSAKSTGCTNYCTGCPHTTACNKQ